MNNIKNEADKLIDYAKDSEEITKEDIDAVCIVQIQDKVFDMVEALAMRDRDKVLRLYSDLLKGTSYEDTCNYGKTICNIIWGKVYDG